MSRPAIELAGIFRQYGPAYRAAHVLPVEQHRLMRAIENCRTAALGGHVDRCGQCDHLRISYNSCRNRHCPKCQGKQRAEWLERRKEDLLPVEYFHVVFTLPPEAAALARQNPAAVYSILFQTSAATLLTVARDRRHLGAEIGFFTLLHTWGQNLHYHPHVHCVVTGGGLALGEQERFVRCRPGFFLPVRVLSRLFRRLFLEAIGDAYGKGKLCFRAELTELAQPAAFAAWLAHLQKIDWVVYAKPPFGGPEAVLAYLARYTHRVAIANERLQSCREGQVTFGWKDYRKHGRRRSMTLEPAEFIRRFLQHTLPPGFQRVRHYGLLANAHRRDKLALCRRLLVQNPTGLLPQPPPPRPVDKAASETRAMVCPNCGAGTMTRIEILPPQREAINSS